METRKWNAKKVAFLAMATAVAVVIEVLCSLYVRMPQGGSFSFVILPIVIAGYYYGIGAAVFVAVAAGVLQGIFAPPVFVNFIQYFLDYLCGFGVLGFATAFIRQEDRADGSEKKLAGRLILGLVVVYVIKYVCHVITGTLFFAEYAGDQIVIVYSMIYNITYVGPTFLAALITAPPILLAIKKHIRQ